MHALLGYGSRGSGEVFSTNAATGFPYKDWGCVGYNHKALSVYKSQCFSNHKFYRLIRIVAVGDTGFYRLIRIHVNTVPRHPKPYQSIKSMLLGDTLSRFTVILRRKRCRHYKHLAFGGEAGRFCFFFCHTNTCARKTMY